MEALSQKAARAEGMAGEEASDIQCPIEFLTGTMRALAEGENQPILYNSLSERVRPRGLEPLTF